MKWYVLAIKQYAVFSGRTSREGFWMFILFNLLYSMLASTLDNALSTRSLTHSGLLSTLYNLFVMIPCLAISVRRLHDIGKSGRLMGYFSVVPVAVLLFTMARALICISDINISTGYLDGEAVILWMGLYFFVVIIWLTVLFCRKGNPGANKYGPNPEEPEDMGMQV